MKNTSMRYHFLSSPELSWPELVRQTRYCEALGFASILLPESPLSSRDPNGSGFDAWVTSGALASQTSFIRLGVLLAGDINWSDAEFVCRAETLDRISGGRVEIAGLGKKSGGDLGDQHPEAEETIEAISAWIGRWNSRPIRPVDWAHKSSKRKMLILAVGRSGLAAGELAGLRARCKCEGIRDICVHSVRGMLERKTYEASDGLIDRLAEAFVGI